MNKWYVRNRGQRRSFKQRTVRGTLYFITFLGFYFVLFNCLFLLEFWLFLFCCSFVNFRAWFIFKKFLLKIKQCRRFFWWWYTDENLKIVEYLVIFCGSESNNRGEEKIKVFFLNHMYIALLISFWVKKVYGKYRYKIEVMLFFW